MKNQAMAACGRFLSVALIFFGAIVSTVHAAPTAYLTSAAEPWNDFSNVDAMNAAFGSNWDRIQYGDSFSTYDMLYIDGGSENATEMVGFLNGNRSSLESYVMGGGRLFINAATELQTTFNLVFGASSTEFNIDNRSYSASALNPSNSLFAGAGNAWDGFFFAHNEISTPSGFGALIADELGRTVLTGGFFGDGYVLLGGQTNTSFHAPVGGSDPFQLRVNELLYALNIQQPPLQVPEPQSYILVLLGLGLVVFHQRRKKVASAV